ncbi:MAG: hypothetical protein AB2L14_33935 [Candidatus Xenobiia bacterium LiM19]
MPQMDWFDYLSAEGFLGEGFLEWPPAQQAALSVRKAQQDMNSLPDRLTKSGVTMEDPVTLGTLVDFITTFTNLSIAVNHYETMAVMYNLKKLQEELK